MLRGVRERSVVLFTADSVHSPSLDRVASRLLVLPKHVWEGVSEPAKYRYPQALMGTGACRLVSMDETAGTYLINPPWHPGVVIDDMSTVTNRFCRQQLSPHRRHRRDEP